MESCSNAWSWNIFRYWYWSPGYIEHLTPTNSVFWTIWPTFQLILALLPFHSQPTSSSIILLYLCCIIGNSFKLDHLEDHSAYITSENIVTDSIVSEMCSNGWPHPNPILRQSKCPLCMLRVKFDLSCPNRFAKRIYIASASRNEELS